MLQSLLAYGPSLTTEQINTLAEKAKSEQLRPLYLQEIAVSRLPEEKRSGMLASLPFSGLMPEQLHYIKTRAEQLCCTHFTFALPGGWVRDARFNELEDYIAPLQDDPKLQLVPTIVVAELRPEVLKDALSFLIEKGIETICLGTGTSLDRVADNLIEVALSVYQKHNISIAKLEIAREDVNPTLGLTKRICLSQSKTHPESY